MGGRGKWKLDVLHPLTEVQVRVLGECQPGKQRVNTTDQN